jgi:hypothetical protein
VTLVFKEEATSLLLQTLRQLLKLELNFVELIAKKAILGMSKLLDKNKSLLRCVVRDIGATNYLCSTSYGLETLVNCVEVASKYPTSEVVAIKLVSELLATDQHLSTSNFSYWIQCITFFTRAKCKPETTLQAMELLFSLYGKVANLCNVTQEKELQAFYAELSSNPHIDTSAEQEGMYLSSSGLTFKAWETFWLPILKLFCVMCKDPRTETRNYAMTFLQKALLSNHLNVLSSLGWYRCFEQVPHIDRVYVVNS